jgi:hypothetical protein
MLLVFPGTQQDTVLKLKLRTQSNDEKKKLLEAEAANEALRKKLAEQTKALDDAFGAMNVTLRDLLQTQRYLSLQAFSDAEAVLGRVFSKQEARQPAHSYVLRGKIRLAQGRRAEARSDFEQALQLLPDDQEVKTLMEQSK